MKCLSMCCAFLLALCLLPATAVVVEIAPSADTYTSTAGGSFGTSPLLNMNNNAEGEERSMLRFDLTPYSGMTILEAKLCLYQSMHCPAGIPCTNDIHDITVSWDETYSGTHIAHGATSWGLATFTVTLGWYEFDVTTLVSAWTSGSTTNYGLVLAPQTGSYHAKVNSKESTTNRPYLKLKYTTAGMETSSLGNIKACYR